MKEWQQLSIEDIRSGVDENGNRLILSFCQDYKNIFGQDADCCHTCPKFQNKVSKYIQKIIEMKDVENSGFKLKPMYDGIRPAFGEDPVSNVNLTDEVAINLINKHPKGVELFEKTPDNIDELISGKSNKKTSSKKADKKA